jgi:uncharacterized protein YpmB
LEDAAMSEEREGMISNVRQLIVGVDRERMWIMTIGLMGIVFAVVFATTMIFWLVLNPVGLIGLESLRLIFRASTWIFGICSVISIVAGIKVLSFIRTWHKNYSNLQAAEKELEREYLDRDRTQ